MKNLGKHFDYQGLDPVMHERARLSILSCLTSSGVQATFGDLKELCSLTDGNLNRHLFALEQDGIVQIEKRQRGNRSVTLVSLTDAGRKRFLDYVEHLDSLVRESLQALRPGRAAVPRALGMTEN